MRHCRACKGTVVVQSGTDKKSVQNERDRKVGNPALSYGSLCDPRAHFWCTCKATYPFPALRKSTLCFPLLREAGKNLLLFQGKEKRTFLLYCDKRNQKHRKGKGNSPSLFDPFPFDKWGRANLSVCAKFPAAAG